MPAKTSISESAARRLAEKAEPGTFLFCDRVAGLHLKALKRPGVAAWRYRYTDPTGRRRVFTLGKFPAMSPAAAAERALQYHEKDPFAERAAQKQAARRAAENTLRAYLDGPYALHQSRKRQGEATLNRLRRAFGDVDDRVPGSRARGRLDRGQGLLDRPLASLTRADIETWQQRCEKKGMAHASLGRDFGALVTLLRHAVRQGTLDKNPLEGVALERPTDDERAAQLSAERATARRLLSDDELRGLYAGLAAFDEELRAQRRNSRAHGKPHLPDLDAVAYAHWFVPFAHLALRTGLRPGDLFSLTWLELNVNFGRLVKVPEKTRHHPAPAQVRMDLSPELLRIMRAWWEQQGKPETGLVFPAPTTGGRLERHAYRPWWKRVKRLGGLPDDLNFYALRHHFISTLVASGVPLLVVAQLAGHKGAAMIEQNYGHLCPRAAADALTIFENSLPAEEGLRPSRSQQ